MGTIMVWISLFTADSPTQVVNNLFILLLRSNSKQHSYKFPKISDLKVSQGRTINQAPSQATLSFWSQNISIDTKQQSPMIVS